jgi:hypothetical protein
LGRKKNGAEWAADGGMDMKNLRKRGFFSCSFPADKALKKFPLQGESDQLFSFSERKKVAKKKQMSLPLNPLCRPSSVSQFGCWIPKNKKNGKFGDTHSQQPLK